MPLKLNTTYLNGFVDNSEIYALEKDILDAHNALETKSGKGSEFTGWLNLPTDYDKEEFERIKLAADKIKANSDIFVSIGIGGSYLGARAIIEALSHQFSALINKPGNTQVIYAGHNMSEEYMVELLELLDNKEYSMAVISKSGTTTEPAVAFRILKNHLENKYGKEEARTRIVAITDKERGALKTLANNEGYKTYIVPDNVGGRYSVLTPVGLLPIAVAGIDIEQLVGGALAMENYCKENQNSDNVVAQYAVARQALYHDGKTNEILVSYEPRLQYIAEWWKQLYGESEGKDGKGIFPASDIFTTDLHSMGQYIQDGLRNLFETIISVERPTKEMRIPLADNDLDQLNYIAGKRLSEVNLTAETATTLAHVDGGVPNIVIQIPEISASTIGELIYFFEMGCALSGYMLEVNPFDQPGVEAYKKNMFALLGKQGFEERAAALRERIK
jgi:glucose-6-phosphate isomerase